MLRTDKQLLPELITLGGFRREINFSYVRFCCGVGIRDKCGGGFSTFTSDLNHTFLASQLERENVSVEG